MSEFSKDGGVFIPSVILRNTELTNTEKIILGYLLAYQTNGSRCFQSNERIAEKVGCGYSTVKLSLSKLLKHGFIERVDWEIEGNRLQAFECSWLKISSGGLKTSQERLKTIPVEAKNDTYSKQSNKQIVNTIEDNSILQKEEEGEKEEGIEDIITLPAKMDRLPLPFTGKLPPTLLAKFQAQGKEEIFENVWMTIPQYEALEAEFGESWCYAALRSMNDWSLNEDCPVGSKIPGYKSYHAKTDHAKTMRNQIKANKSRGRMPVKTGRGWEFDWASSANQKQGVLPSR